MSSSSTSCLSPPNQSKCDPNIDSSDSIPITTKFNQILKMIPPGRHHHHDHHRRCASFFAHHLVPLTMTIAFAVQLPGCLAQFNIIPPNRYSSESLNMGSHMGPHMLPPPSPPMSAFNPMTAPADVPPQPPDSIYDERIVQSKPVRVQDLRLSANGDTQPENDRNTMDNGQEGAGGHHAGMTSGDRPDSSADLASQASPTLNSPAFSKFNRNALASGKNYVGTYYPYNYNSNGNGYNGLNAYYPGNNFQYGGYQMGGQYGTMNPIMGHFYGKFQPVMRFFQKLTGKLMSPFTGTMAGGYGGSSYGGYGTHLGSPYTGAYDYSLGGYGSAYPYKAGPGAFLRREPSYRQVDPLVPDQVISSGLPSFSSNPSSVASVASVASVGSTNQAERTRAALRSGTIAAVQSFYGNEDTMTMRMGPAGPTGRALDDVGSSRTLAFSGTHGIHGTFGNTGNSLLTNEKSVPSRSQDSSGSTSGAKLHPTAAVISLNGADGVSGVISAVQLNGVLRLDGWVKGLQPGGHGIHIHDQSGLAGDCSGATIGQHYNPLNRNHGSSQGADRHLGDLGNVLADQKGIARIHIESNTLSLKGTNSIVNRTLGITEKTDDLGLTDNVGSKLDGNSGKIVACGRVQLLN